MCEFCEKHKALLSCRFDGIGVTVKIINHTQLDAMAKVKCGESVISVGQSNRIKYCPVCGKELKD
ncbi:hypothetical protein [Limosilactobacillus sp.]|nr:hypothetical protein [Limosilactobacillus sp.]MCC6096979.1 hypothetical protein [Limosilactobacillus sp.]